MQVTPKYIMSKLNEFSISLKEMSIEILKVEAEKTAGKEHISQPYYYGTGIRERVDALIRELNDFKRLRIPRKVTEE